MQMKNTWNIPLFKLNYNEKETRSVERVLKSQWLSMGNETIELENNFKKMLGNNYECVAVSSCTAGIHLSMLAAEIEPGDEIIVPSLSFIAQLNIISNLRAKPVLIDCTSLDNWNLNVNKILNKITKKTKAIVLLHYAGVPCEITKELIEACKKRRISIIEDVAHAPGAKKNGKMCGTLGDFGCFSFFSNKNISAGEGGLISVKSKSNLKKLQLLRSHGMTKLSFDKINGRATTYDVTKFGLNYRIDEIRASLAKEQLKKLISSNKKRKYLFKNYANYLKNTTFKIPFLSNKNLEDAAYHIFVILLPKNINRNKLIQYLKSKGIQTSIHYPAVWSFNKYKHMFNKKNFPICNEICRRQLTLPLYPDMKKEEVEKVCKYLKAY